MNDGRPGRWVRPVRWACAGVVATAGLVAGSVVAGGVGGCAEERRVVGVRGGLQNLPGAVGGIRAERGGTGRIDPSAVDPWAPVLSAWGAETLEGDETHALRHTDEGGEVTLILSSPTALLRHIYETLERGEHELLYEQVLSDRLKRNYVETFRDPRDALEYLVRHREDVGELLLDVPAGESTPGASFRVIGRGTFRLIAPGRETLGRRFNAIDMIIEEGEFRLLLIR